MGKALHVEQINARRIRISRHQCTCTCANQFFPIFSVREEVSALRSVDADCLYKLPCPWACERPTVHQLAHSCLLTRAHYCWHAVAGETLSANCDRWMPNTFG